MEDEGNISGFLSMFGKTDGTGDYQQSASNLKTRFANRDKHYQSLTGNIEKKIRSVLSTKPMYKPKTTFRKSSQSFNLPKIKLPQTATIINIALLGGVALVGYKLYMKFFGTAPADSILDHSSSAGDEAIAKIHVDTNQSKADVIKRNENALATKGLYVSDLHRNIANTLHEALDSLWVNHDSIVNIILKENIQTFRLVSVAYGSRPLSSYAKSPAHLFNGKVWGDLLRAERLEGTLKNHLTYVLTDSELKKLSHFLSVI